MKAFVQRSVFVLLALLAVRGDGLRGQWGIVAPAAGGESLCAKNGIIWTISSSVFFSKDTGRTWKSIPFNLPYPAIDIAFFDSLNGVFGTVNYVYNTSDGGLSWIPILSGTYNYSDIRAVLYGNSASEIYGFDESGLLYITKNKGISWTSAGFGGIGFTMTASKGTIYVDGAGGRVGNGRGVIRSSTDGGLTWIVSSGSVDEDSYGLIADSCNNLFVANENYLLPDDQFCKIFSSRDGGNTWKVDYKDRLGVVSGCISASNSVIYAGTMDSLGVLRSTDEGSTWSRIGGPAQYVDTRNILAINDNTVFAIDKSGNIWGTYNSGGNPVLPLKISPSDLFVTDTADCDSLNQSLDLTLSPFGCNPDLGFSAWVIGADSMAYSVGTGNASPLPVTFHPTHFGSQNALLVFEFKNGAFDTINLGGYSLSERPLFLTTRNQKNDTVGGDIAVPITINNLNHPENINLILHYDPTLQYQGSFDAANVKLDIAGEQWPGRSKLNIALAQSGVIAGYARFNVFADSVAKPQVTFDSLEVLSATSPCEYTLPAAVTSTITPPSGCGAIILSEFLKNGQVPTFTIRPNPTMSDVAITSSLDLGDAEVEIYDMLGRERDDVTVSLTKGLPVSLSMPESAGIYYLRVKSVAGIRSMSVVVAK